MDTPGLTQSNKTKGQFVIQTVWGFRGVAVMSYSRYANGF